MDDNSIKQILRTKINADESLIWVGRSKRFPIGFIGIYGLVFSVVWCAIVFSIFGRIFLSFILPPYEMLPDSNGDVSIVGVMLGFGFVSIFIFAGLFSLFFAVKLVFGPNKQLYAVTSKRVLILDRFLSRRTVSIYPEQLSEIERTGRDNIGTLFFGENNSPVFATNIAWKIRLNKFLNISNPRKVEALIHKTFAS